MRTSAIFTEGWRMARAHLVASLLLCGVLALMVATALSTVGTGIAGAERLRAQMEEAGARVLVISDNTPEGGYVTPAVVSQASRLTSVVTALGFGRAFDTTFGPHHGGDPVAAWEVSEVDAAIEIAQGRPPQSGEAFITEETAATWSMTYPTGYLVDGGGREFPIVGIGRLAPGFEYFDGGSLVAARGEEFQSLHVLVDALPHADSTQAQILSLLGAPNQNQLSISTPAGMRMSAELVSSNVAAQNRAMTATIIAVGGLLIAGVGLADVLLSRRDFGRRRALGGSRSDLVAVTVARTLVPALIGALTGAISALVFYRMRGITIPLDVGLAFVILALTVSLLACLIPAVWASRRDPVVVLRTP